MATEETRAQAPPVGEEVHLPGPSILPLITAVGITLMLIGVTIFPLLSLLGLIVTVWCSVRWIRETRRDVAELPLSHE